MNKNIKPKRPRISKGILVASTNPVQLACLKSLTIVCVFRPISYKRVRRYVKSEESLLLPLSMPYIL